MSRKNKSKNGIIKLFKTLKLAFEPNMNLFIAISLHFLKIIIIILSRTSWKAKIK